LRFNLFRARAGAGTGMMKEYDVLEAAKDAVHFFLEELPAEFSADELEEAIQSYRAGGQLRGGEGAAVRLEARRCVVDGAVT